MAKNLVDVLRNHSHKAVNPPVPVSLLVHDADRQMDPISHAENQLEVVLDDLQNTGCLEHESMDIDLRPFSILKSRQSLTMLRMQKYIRQLSTIYI